MKLSDALLWAEDENTVNDNVCLITKEKIKNEIKLPCGHIFEYDALLNNFLNTIGPKIFYMHKCPYCRTEHNGFIPYYKTDKNHDINQFKRTNNTYFKCSHVFKGGKNKGNNCTSCAHKFENGIYCIKHYSYYNKLQNKPRCSKILKNGNRCKCNVFDKETKLCKRHFNLLKNNS